MIKINAICDFCKNENYLKYNGAKGTFVSPIEWDLCPVCYERITAIIRDNLIKKETI